jgi:hypothetical protein
MCLGQSGWSESNRNNLRWCRFIHSARIHSGNKLKSSIDVTVGPKAGGVEDFDNEGFAKLELYRIKS